VTTDRRRPWLVALRGAPGSGKSTIGAALSRELGWPLVDKDEIQDVLDLHLTATEGPAYEVMFRVARTQVRLGLSVILDSPFWRRTYDNALALAAEQGARLAVLECRCADEALWRRRVEARQGTGLPTRRTSTWDALQAYRQRYEQDAYAIAVPHLVVDTAEEPSAIVSQVRSWLGLPTPT
jgi:predicted kinase